MTPAPTLESRRLHPQGAEILEGGVHYRTWCKHDHASVLILDERMEVRRTIRLRSERGDYFSGFDDQGGAGDLYRYCFDQERSWPDPASRFQPTGVHGSSLVVDPATFRWTDQTWVAPPCPELVLYELHIGTFTPEGTFRAAITKLDHLVRLGVNAIEIMPVGDFSGERNWGYDGVLLYAPARTYGNPDDLRALVDAAHGRGLGIILDVVYNHMGPDGNYLGVYHPGYFNPEHKTPWGAGLNFVEEAVREFVAGNTIYWMRDFHIDGFRLDATHAILDSSEKHILAEISERVHEAGGFLIAEDDRNAPEVLRRVNEGGLGFDGVWSDDFHHVVRVALTSEHEGYYEHFCGTPTELAETLQHGWLFRGQQVRRDGTKRGGESIQFDSERFVYCITNHDQVGNRAFGERLGQVIEPAAYRAASALLCLVPYTPMLFMGQEWSASSPFQFFTDHAVELGKLVTEGRRREFQHFTAFRDPEVLKRIPDPQAQSTFANSKLRWDEVNEPQHEQILQLYREFLRLRRMHPAFRDPSRGNWDVREIGGIVCLRLGLRSAARALVLIDLVGGHTMPDLSSLADGESREWKSLISSNEVRFGGDTAPPLTQPTTVVFGEAR